MRIYDKDDDMQECESAYGNYYIELTLEEITALLNGKVLADPSPYHEYGVFVSLEGGT